MRPLIGWDWHFWAVGFVYDDEEKSFIILLGPLGIYFGKTPPHVSMQDLDKAQQEQYADWMDELQAAGLIQQVRVVERMPSSDKVM